MTTTNEQQQQTNTQQQNTTPTTTTLTPTAPGGWVPEHEREMTDADRERFAGYARTLGEMKAKSGAATTQPSGHLVNRPLTDEEKARVEANTAERTKVEEGKNTDGTTRAQYEARLAELRKDPDYWSDTPRHKTIMAEQQRILAALATDAEREAVMQAPLPELRERFGIRANVPAAILEKWDNDTEATVLGTLAVQGVTAEAARAIHSWYSQVFTAHGGDAANIDPVALEADFRAVAKRAGLAQDLVDALVEYERARLGFK